VLDLVGRVALGEEDLGGGLHQRFGRVIADEPAAQLAADEARRAGMIGEQIEHGAPVLLRSRIRRQVAAQHQLVEAVMSGLGEEERAGVRHGRVPIAVVVGHPPAGESARRLVHIIVHIADRDAVGQLLDGGVPSSNS
jgi:hypothetical protein